MLDRNLATLGAAITVFSVVIGTFSQQAIQTVSCQKPSPSGAASIPVMQTSLQALQEGFMPGDYDLEVTAKDSVIAGLAGSQSPNPLSPPCSSGNCTFKEIKGITHTTAGFSSECIEISYLITQGGPLTWTVGSEDHAETNYSLPNELTLTWMVREGGWDTMLVRQSPLPEMASGMSFFENVTMTERQRNIYLHSAFDGIFFLMPTTSPCEDPASYLHKEDSDGKGEDWLSMPPVNVSSCPTLAQSLPGATSLLGYFSITAAFCFFYSSIQSYNGSVTNGRLVEHPVNDPLPLDNVLGPDGLAAPESGPWNWQCGFADPCIVDGVIYTNTSANLADVPAGLMNLSI